VQHYHLAWSCIEHGSCARMNRLPLCVAEFQQAVTLHARVLLRAPCFLCIWSTLIACVGQQIQPWSPSCRPACSPHKGPRNDMPSHFWRITWALGHLIACISLLTSPCCNRRKRACLAEVAAPLIGSDCIIVVHRATACRGSASGKGLGSEGVLVVACSWSDLYWPPGSCKSGLAVRSAS